MAKGCLDKLTGNILSSCALPQVGVAGLYLMYPEDVTFTFLDLNRQISAVNFATGAKSYYIEGYKQNIQITSTLRTTDASVRNDVAITFKIIGGIPSLWSRIQNGKFYVLEIPNQTPGGAFNIWGLNAPLECTGFEYDSNANMGAVTVTLSAPEGSAGNNRTTGFAAVKDSIIQKSV